MSIYYVSADGCDKNDGLTPETAWQTISKVNSEIVGGDEVRFRRGDTFYGAIRAPHGIDEAHRTTYTAYGEGKKPVISQYKKAKAAWEKHEDGVYKLDLMNPDNFTGNVFDLDPGVGFIKVSGKIYYENKFTYEELSEQWDFCSDSKYVYVKLDKNPAEVSDDIILACNIKFIQFVKYLCVCGLNFTGTGGHGIQGVTEGSYIADCEFHEIGGSYMYNEHGKLIKCRYGNGVECWANSANVTVERCKFSDIYDVAMSIQGWKVVRNWENIVFRDNIVWNCTQAFEIWTSPEKEGTGLVNCAFENNICIDSGYGWGHEARSDKPQSTHLLIYHLDCDLCDIRICGNVFQNARNCEIFKKDGAAAIPDDYKVYNNTFIRNPDIPIVFRWGGTPESDYTAYEEKLRKENRFYDIIKY